MFDILLSVCMAVGGVCADRLLPVSLPTRAVCEQQAPQIASDWADEIGGIAYSEARCVAHADLPEYISPLTATEVSPGVVVHQGMHDVPSAENFGDLANLGFVIGHDAVAVVDAGGSRAVAERFYSAIRARTDLPIRWLLLTHMHPDHSLGADFFREAGATIIGHPNLEIGLANRAESYQTALRRLLGPKAYLGTRLTGPDQTAERREIDLGGRVLLVEAHPIAHTDNDLTVLDRATGTWFVGDLVFAEHTPALDGSILGWQSLLESMAATKAARIVPGHGPATLDWPSGADALRVYLSALTAEARAAIAAGEPLSEAIHHVGESQREYWLLFDEFNKRNATAAFTELEWE